MKRARVLLLLLLLAGPAAAQKECGNGLPCGPVPWTLPLLPELNTPTPMPTIEVIVTSAASPTPGPSPTPGGPVSTSAPHVDVSGIDEQFSTLQAILATSPTPFYDANGTPLAANYEELGTNAGLFFGYTRGLSSVSFGSLSPLIVFSLTALVTVLSVKLVTFLWPVLAAIFGFIRKIIDLILGFLPL